MTTPTFPPVLVRIDVLALAGIDVAGAEQTTVAGRPHVVLTRHWLDLRDLSSRIARVAGSALAAGPHDEIHVAARACVDVLENAIAKQRRAK